RDLTWKPHGHRPPQTSPVHVDVQTSANCGSDWYCNLGLKDRLDDARATSQKQVEDAQEGCRSIKCEEAIDDNVKYHIVDDGEGHSYLAGDGNTLITFTNENRVKEVAAQKAKAAECQKSFWCRATKWAQDHAGIVSAIA